MAVLRGRIEDLERRATALRASSGCDEAAGKVDLLLASLHGARVCVGGELDDDAQADLERMVDAVGDRLTTLRD